MTSATTKAINAVQLPVQSEAPLPKKTGHTRPRRPEMSLNEPGRLRVSNLLALLNISHSTLYAGLKHGRYPSPDGKDGNFPYWKTSTIKTFLEV